MMLRRESYNVPVAISLLFFDVDHFKSVNDTHGHKAGDNVLQKIGSLLQDMFKRDTDIVGRWGGEEFVVALPACNEPNAAILAEKLRKLIEETEIEIGDEGESRKIKVTVSIGAVTAGLHKLTEPDVIGPINDIIGRADAHMYHAKHTGRNRVCSGTVFYGQQSDEPVLS